jgi:Undecaprenyl-phosphate galactose phosphotransferase WbaP
MMQSAITTLPLLLVDLIVTTVALVVACYLVNLAYGRTFYFLIWKQLPPLLMFQIGLMWLHQVYPAAGISRVDELRAIFRSTVLALCCLSGINILFAELPRIEFITFAVACLTTFLMLPLVRLVVRGRLATTSWWGIRMLLIGDPADCEEVIRRSRAYRSSGFIVGESINLPESSSPRADQDLIALTRVAFDVGCASCSPVAAIVSYRGHQLSHRLMFQFPSVIWVDQPSTCELNAEASELLGLLSLQTNMPLLRTTPRVLKRTLDLAVTIPTLIVLAIPMAAIAIAIKVASRGPVIFGPVRMGQHGKEFKSWKFRTMVPNAEQVLKERLESDPEARAEWERDVKLKNDPRIIPGIGHLLRNWSLDELPQLWNVLVGEMSLIGPRPIAAYEIERYREHYHDYTQMLPGITGLWQVSGRSETSYETRVQMVHRYAAKWSIWLDVWILAKTPIVVFTKRGAC